MTVSIHICNRDRWGELGLLLQSLRTQTYQDFDIVILDENETSITQCYFLMMLLNRMKLEGHGVNIIRNNLKLGVCYARQKLVDEDYFKDNSYILRLDDDVILEKDYIEKLLKVIKAGYDIASGVTPLLGSPELIRNIDKVKPVINRKEFDNEGNLTYYGEDCGFCYDKEEILSANEFRSCALFKREIFNKISYEKNLSFVGFREECFLSFRAITLGYRIGVHTGAKIFHLASPTGGCRFPDYTEKVQSDNKYFYEWVKEWQKKNKM